MNDARNNERQLELPAEIGGDAHAIELVSAWFSRNKVKIMTRRGTGLDQNPGNWGEILVSIARTPRSLFRMFSVYRHRKH